MSVVKVIPEQKITKCCECPEYPECTEGNGWLSEPPKDCPLKDWVEPQKQKFVPTTTSWETHGIEGGYWKEHCASCQSKLKTEIKKKLEEELPEVCEKICTEELCKSDFGTKECPATYCNYFSWNKDWAEIKQGVQ